jgi:murein DD-endopeptidase MepM/ murein hydrolase activator NlpD
MRTKPHLNPPFHFSRFGGTFALALGLTGVPPALAQTQTYPCETVMQFGTGMSAGGAKLRPGGVDPFFQGTSANFPDRPDVYVVTDPSAAWIANSASADSQWIGPSPSVADDASGTYIYRLQFTTPCAGARVTGRYAASDRGALRLNGSAAVSFPTPAVGYNVWTSYSFNNLPAGLNTLEFYVTNAPSAVGPPGPTGLRAELTVTATCCPCIVLTCPSDIFLTTCSTGATANFSITGTNRCYTNLTINCVLNVAGANIPVTPTTVFPPGTNTVLCDASDTVGHTTNCSFRVVVTRDRRPPEIDCPRAIVYLCRGGGTNVFYNVPATDDTDPNPVVTCEPPSGSFFPPGTNTVTCEARDSCGRISKCSFPVIIAPNGFVKTLQAGVADNFLPNAFEAPNPGPCLAASGFWTGMPFDTSWPGRQMSHSFQALPPNIVAAKLTLHMRPTQAASQDDVLRLGLQNCGAAGVWAFAQDVASLPGAGGTWAANPPTTFTLDLAALPGGLSLLADLNATHRLEFAVGAETMVDFAQLEVTYCGPQTTLSGVPYSLNNAYPIHQGGSGVSWRTVNSNGPPPTVEIDLGEADGFRFDIAKADPGLFSFCQLGSPISQHHGLATDWPTGEGTIATLGINAAATAGQTRISMSQPSNMIGKSVEVWNAGQLVSRYFLPGTADTAVNVPASACLVQMGFLTGYFFAAFESAVPIDIVSGGQHISGQAGPVVNGTSVRLSYVITVNAGGPTIARATLPIGGLSISKMSLLRGEDWIDAYGPQQVSVSDVVWSKALIDLLPQSYGDCSPAYGPWTLDLNGVAGFCTFEGANPPQCNNGYVDVNIIGGGGTGGTTLNFGGLRITPTALPLDDCHIECTVADGSAVPYSLTIHRMVGGPITLNNVSAADFSNWPLAVTGNAGPQAFGVTLPANTIVTIGTQNYTANGATFHATPQVLGEFYQVCLETTFQPQMSFKSYHTTGGPPLASDCLTLNCPTNVVVNCLNEAGTVVTFNPTGATRCGSNVVITCVPPSGSVFPPGTSVVRCEAIDSQGNQDQCRFLVTVRDITAPQLVIPARVIAPCTSPRGAMVDFASGATDHCDPSPVVECDPPSGSVFPVGTNRVTCVGVDAGGNRAVGAFNVIVSGGCGTNSCIDITVPADIEAPCTTAGGAVVTFSASARNTCTGGVVPLTCAPPSGSLFAVGLTHVVCTTPAGAGQASASFPVEVTDVVPPQINCPSNVVAAAQSPLGAVVSYTVTATDDCAPPPRIRCSPPGGSVFPVGDTRVFCEAADGHGNVTTCAFVVTVRPPRPLTATRVAGNRVELRWVGDADVQSTDVLSDDPLWRPVNGTPTSNGLERILILPVEPGHKFFRILPRPLLPPTDRDGDGVPDERDRCPDTPAGLRVDEFGCALFDLIASPEDVLQHERKRASETAQRLRLNQHLAHLAARLDPLLVNSNSPSLPLYQRQMPQALLLESNLVRELRLALEEFLRMKPSLQAALERAAPDLDWHADVREQDLALLELEDIERGLTESLAQGEHTLTGLSNIVRAISLPPTRGTATIGEVNPGQGAARLTDGRRLLLPGVTSPGAPPVNQIPGVLAGASAVNLQFHALPDGSILGALVEPEAGISPNLAFQVNPRRLRLRVVPANPSLPDWDTGIRHHLKAYKWGFTPDGGYHFLEFGMALVTIKSATPTGNYKHWLKVLVDDDGDGGYYPLIFSMDENSAPVVLKASQLPGFKPFPMLIREFRAPIQSNGNLGTIELLGEETHTIELYQPGSFAEAEYSRTLFELPDDPNTTAFQSAQVTGMIRYFPLTLQPENQQQFQAASYKVTGNSSTHPGVQTIYPGESFAVHFSDPNAHLFFAFPEDLGRALYSPSVRGVRNGKPFQYKAALPRIVRDRLHDCATDSYYRIPFIGPLPAGLFGPWHVSQGNNGEFTHNGTQRHAFDFPKPAGTEVLAARGGIVIDIRENGMASCWNPDADDGEGDCVNCTGTRAGNFVRIRHQDDTVGVYVHFRFNGVSVNVGQRVYRGDLIGYVGSTGCSTGPHLHFHVTNSDQSDTIPIRFETYDDDFDFRNCFLPPHDSDGFSTNEPYWWPF